MRARTLVASLSKLWNDEGFNEMTAAPPGDRLQWFAGTSWRIPTVDTFGRQDERLENIEPVVWDYRPQGFIRACGLHLSGRPARGHDERPCNTKLSSVGARHCG